mmetsp:Transcript_15451/g.46622  ORF Transcript_15451/g.46622 Transcript_15451/m.46622 type:complete len:222 (-) Transcript_15451:371-1036(-)
MLLSDRPPQCVQAGGAAGRQQHRGAGETADGLHSGRLLAQHALQPGRRHPHPAAVDAAPLAGHRPRARAHGSSPGLPPELGQGARVGLGSGGGGLLGAPEGGHGADGGGGGGGVVQRLVQRLRPRPAAQGGQAAAAPQRLVAPASVQPSGEVEVVIVVQLPQRRASGFRHKIPEEQVDGCLLVRIRVGVGVKTADGCHQIAALGGRLPVPSLALKERRVRL